MNTHTQNKPHISTHREARFLAQLLTGKTAVHDLRAISGAENHWQLKADIKNSVASEPSFKTNQAAWVCLPSSRTLQADLERKP